MHDQVGHRIVSDGAAEAAVIHLRQVRRCLGERYDQGCEPNDGSRAQPETCAKCMYARFMNVSMMLSKAEGKRVSVKAKGRAEVRTLCVGESVSTIESFDAINLMEFVEGRAPTRSVMHSHIQYSGIFYMAPRSSGPRT